MRKGVKHFLLAEFKTIFHDEEPSSLDVYLEGISRSMLMHVGVFFLGFSNQESEYEDFKKVLSSFFGPENEGFANDLNARFEKLKDENTKDGSAPDILVINPPSSLQLFEYGFENLNDVKTQSKQDAEINIFKSYLILNERNAEKDIVAIKSTINLPKDLSFAAMSFAQSFPYSDLINYDVAELVTSQWIKAMYLFEFIESREETKPMLVEFENYYAVENWKEYLNRLLPIAFLAVQAVKEGNIDLVVPQDDKYESNCTFIEKLIVSDQDSIVDYDYKIIRAQPLYKIDEGKYRLIFPLYVYEKIFRGLYFKFYELNNLQSAETQISNWRSFYCDNFSEQKLVYEVLNRIYKNRYINFNGKEMREAGLDGEPDYYIRNGNNVFLFESKDILIRADVKQSADFDMYEAELKKRLFYEEKEGRIKNRAILQLIHNISRLLKNEFTVDTNYKRKSLKIYPILLVHSGQFNTVGLNVILNSWFQEKLEKLNKDGVATDGVRQVVIVDIDTIIFHQDLLIQRKIKLEKIIDSYFKFIEFDEKKRYRDMPHMKQFARRSLVPFAVFISNFVSENKMTKVPNILKEKGYDLFEDRIL